jgi:uncharacterized OB-fold protein
LDKKERESYYRYNSERYNIPAAYLRREFEDELSGKLPIDAPLEIPDKMEILYKYSCGQQSRFFRELRENKTLYGTKCGCCGKVYCPPRADCSFCYTQTDWIPLPGTGIVESCAVQYFTTSEFIQKLPFICAYIRLDGVDFLMLALMEAEDVSRVKTGTRVEIRFKEQRNGTITDFYFTPVL